MWAMFSLPLACLGDEQRQTYLQELTQPYKPDGDNPRGSKWRGLGLLAPGGRRKRYVWAGGYKRAVQTTEDGRRLTLNRQTQVEGGRHVRKPDRAGKRETGQAVEGRRTGGSETGSIKHRGQRLLLSPCTACLLAGYGLAGGFPSPRHVQFTDHP